MTFKDLQKVIESEIGSTKAAESNQILLQKLRGKPFWYWDKTRHKERDRITKGECCWNHCVGLPKKNGIEIPLYDYEKVLYKALLEPGFLSSNPKLHSSDPNNIMYPFKEKHLWILKATGLGVKEFMLRFMAWLCVRNDDYRGAQMVIVTGPNQELAIKLIK